MSETIQVNSVDKIVSGNGVSTSNSDLFSTNPPNDQPDDSTKTLLNIFDEDIITSSDQNQESSEEAVNQTTETVVSNRSFLERMRAWWYGIPDEEQPVQKSINSGLCKEELINPTPVLEAPKGVYLNPRDIGRIPQSGGLEAKEGEHLTSAELVEVLSLMSDNTLEEVMRIVIKAQLEFEQQSAEVYQESFEKNKNFVKIHQKMVDEIQNALERDTKIGEWLKKINKGLFVAAAIASVACVIIRSDYFPAIKDSIGQIFGEISQDWVERATTSTVHIPGVSLLIGDVHTYQLATSVISGCLMGLGSFGSKYNDWKTNIDSGEHQKAKHILVMYDKRREELRDNVVALAEEDRELKEQLMDQIKRFRRLKNIINRSQ